MVFVLKSISPVFTVFHDHRLYAFHKHLNFKDSGAELMTKGSDHKEKKYHDRGGDDETP